MNNWPETPAEIDAFNDEARRCGFLWRETKMPRLRNEYIASGHVPRTAVLDNIVSIEELLTDPFEIWRCDWWSDAWFRVEIEG